MSSGTRQRDSRCSQLFPMAMLVVIQLPYLIFLGLMLLLKLMLACRIKAHVQNSVGIAVKGLCTTGSKLGSRGGPGEELLLAMEILHDLIYSNLRNHGSIAQICFCTRIDR